MTIEKILYKESENWSFFNFYFVKDNKTQLPCTLAKKQVKKRARMTNLL